MSTTGTATSTLTQAEREMAHEHLRQAQALLTGAIKGLTAAQWNFAPDKNWSIGQIVEHVIFVYELVDKRILEALPSAPPTPERDHAAIDALTINRFPNRLAKFNAPEVSVPSGCYATPAEALARLGKIAAQFAKQIDSQQDLRGHAIDSPPLKAITQGEHTVMDGYQWILAASAHAERHVKQILEVRADPKFPV